MNARSSALRPQATRDHSRNQHPQGKPWKVQLCFLITALMAGVFRVPVGSTNRVGYGDGARAVFLGSRSGIRVRKGV
eukprot:9409765-Pyramimonas_sp.AAC.1